MDLVELAPGMGPAGDLVDRSSFVEMMEAGVGVGLESALIELDVLAWPLTLAVGRVGEPDGGRGGIAGGAVVANVGPEPASLRLAVAWREHRNRRVVGVQLGGRQHVVAYGGDQRSQQLAGRADPAGQRGTIQVGRLRGRRCRTAGRAADDRHTSRPAHGPAVPVRRARGRSAAKVPAPARSGRSRRSSASVAHGAAP